MDTLRSSKPKAKPPKKLPDCQHKRQKFKALYVIHTNFVRLRDVRVEMSKRLLNINANKSLTMHFSRIKAANVTSLNLLGTITKYCLSFSGTAKFSWSIQFEEPLASFSICNAGLRLFWTSSAMEILMGSFKLISASRVTPEAQKMKNT